jgi:hypothetical protein
MPDFWTKPLRSQSRRYQTFTTAVKMISVGADMYIKGSRLLRKGYGLWVGDDNPSPARAEATALFSQGRELLDSGIELQDKGRGMLDGISNLCPMLYYDHEVVTNKPKRKETK